MNARHSPRLLGLAAAAAVVLAGCATSPGYDGSASSSGYYGGSSANCYDCGTVTHIEQVGAGCAPRGCRTCAR